MNEVKVSVLIPVYNRIDIVHLAIDSALRQTYDNYEIIICDNCSTDGTFEYICKKYGGEKRVQIYQNSENLGPVNNWIMCLQKSHGEYIKFLWSDDWIAENFLEETVSALEANQDVGLALTDVRWCNLEENRTSVGYKLWIKKIINILFKDQIRQYYGYYWGNTGKYESEIFLHRVYEGIRSYPVSASCALIRRKCLEIVPEIENSFGVLLNRTGAGIDLLELLFTFKSYDHFYYIDQKLACFGIHGGSLTAQNKLDYEYWVAQKYYLDSVPLKREKYDNYKELFMCRILFLNKEEGTVYLQKLFENGDLYLPEESDVNRWGKKWQQYNKKRQIAFFFKIESGEK